MHNSKTSWHKEWTLELLNIIWSVFYKMTSFFNLLSAWYEVELQEKKVWQSRSGSNSNINVSFSRSCWKLWWSFKERGKLNQVSLWIKLKLEKAIWSCYFILWLIFEFISWWVLKTCNWKLLEPAALLSYCLYTILFLWPDWINLSFEICQIANESLPRYNFWVTCMQSKPHLYWTLVYN